MNHDRKSISVSVKTILIISFVSLISLAGCIALTSRALLLIDHFERFYEPACFLIWILQALLLGFVAKRQSGNPLIICGSVLLIVLLFTLVTGIILGMGNADFARLGLRFSVYAAFSMFLSVLPHKKKTARKRKSIKR